MGRKAQGRTTVFCDHRNEGSWLCWLCHTRHWACVDVCPNDDGGNAQGAGPKETKYYLTEQDPPVLLTKATNFRSKKAR